MSRKNRHTRYNASTLKHTKQRKPGAPHWFVLDRFVLPIRTTFGQSETNLAPKMGKFRVVLRPKSDTVGRDTGPRNWVLDADSSHTLQNVVGETKGKLRLDSRFVAQVAQRARSPSPPYRTIPAAVRNRFAIHPRKGPSRFPSRAQAQANKVFRYSRPPQYFDAASAEGVEAEILRIVKRPKHFTLDERPARGCCETGTPFFQPRAPAKPAPEFPERPLRGQHWEFWVAAPFRPRLNGELEARGNPGRGHSFSGPTPPRFASRSPPAKRKARRTAHDGRRCEKVQ
jgi:hypothetical protein